MQKSSTLTTGFGQLSTLLQKHFRKTGSKRTWKLSRIAGTWQNWHSQLASSAFSQLRWAHWEEQWSMQLNSTLIQGLSTRYSPFDHMTYFQAQRSIVEQKYDMERLCLL